jgi:hypothetical protein
MASLATQYSKKFRNKLSYFPVWEPGWPISPGSIGRLRHGVFSQEGQVTDVFKDLSYEIKDSTVAKSMSFYSDSGISISGGVSGSHLVQVNGTIRVSFSRANAVVFHATTLTLRYIDGLYRIISLIAKRRNEWPKGLVLVSHMEVAERYAVLISESGGWDLELRGEASALASLHIADASVSVTTVNGAGYHRSGTGPVTSRIYGFKTFDRQLRLLSAHEPINDGSPFDEISPFDPTLDINEED